MKVSSVSMHRHAQLGREAANLFQLHAHLASHFPDLIKHPEIQQTVLQERDEDDKIRNVHSVTAVYWNISETYYHLLAAEHILQERDEDDKIRNVHSVTAVYWNISETYYHLLAAEHI